MTYEALKSNIQHMKEITRELYVFTNQLEIIKSLEARGSLIDIKEKKLLNDAVIALTNQMNMLNNSIPGLIEGIGFYKKFNENTANQEKNNLIQINYKPVEDKPKVSLTITDKDKKEFLENLSKSNLSISKLKKKYVIADEGGIISKPSTYAKFSNRFFKKVSNNLIAKGYFEQLNKKLRKMNSKFILSSYVSIIFFSVVLSFIASIFLFLFLLFFNISPILPFITHVEDTFIFRFLKIFWIIFAIPIGTGLLLYLYPSSESKNLGTKIDRELAFVTIHMAAIASSGIEPISIFRIILKNEEYKYTNIEIKKLLNLINFHGDDLITALKKVSRACPSSKLRELMDGIATTATSGGDLYQFLDKHADSLLFDYKLERERYMKASETFMNIYISVVIAAPMILLMLFVIIGSTGMFVNFLGLSSETLGILIIFMIILLNIGFLAFLRMQQPEL